MKKDEKKRLCQGCRNDYYNQTGNSTTGECWSLASAKLVERTAVGVWQNPPYTWQPQQTLSCHCPEGRVWIQQDDPRIKGAVAQYDAEHPPEGETCDWCGYEPCRCEQFDRAYDRAAEDDR